MWGLGAVAHQEVDWLRDLSREVLQFRSLYGETIPPGWKFSQGLGEQIAVTMQYGPQAVEQRKAELLSSMTGQGIPLEWAQLQLQRGQAKVDFGLSRGADAMNLAGNIEGTIASLGWDPDTMLPGPPLPPWDPHCGDGSMWDPTANGGTGMCVDDPSYAPPVAPPPPNYDPYAGLPLINSESEYPTSPNEMKRWSLGGENYLVLKGPPGPLYRHLHGGPPGYVHDPTTPEPIFVGATDEMAKYYKIWVPGYEEYPPYMDRPSQAIPIDAIITEPVTIAPIVSQSPVTDMVATGNVPGIAPVLTTVLPPSQPVILPPVGTSTTYIPDIPEAVPAGDDTAPKSETSNTLLYGALALGALFFLRKR